MMAQKINRYRPVYPFSQILNFLFSSLPAISFLVSILLPLTVTAQSGVAPRTSNILTLNSYHYGYDWTDKTSVKAVPVYALHETRPGHGLVGGMLLNGIGQGAKAGAMALSVLRGEDPDHFPVFTAGTARPMFDCRQLQHHNISLNNLPPGSRIVNRPGSFFEKNQSLWSP